MSKDSSFYTYNIGNSYFPFDTIYAKNLSDGTTTKTMTEVLNKQDKLTSGDNITISEDNVISATVPENVVTTDTAQTITGKKVFTGTLQAASLSDGTTTKTMTEVLAGRPYRHIIRVNASTAPTKSYCFE